MAKVNRPKAGGGKRIRSVENRPKVDSQSTRPLAARMASLKADIADIDPTMLSALSRCEKRCDGKLLDGEALRDLAERAKSKRGMDAFEKIAASADVFDEGLKRHLDAVSSASTTVAAAPAGEQALDLEFFTDKDKGVAKIALKEDGKTLDDTGSAVLRYIGRRHAKSMTTEAKTFISEFTSSYQADISALQQQEQRAKEAQQFLDSENEASLKAWDENRATADQIRDASSNFNRKIKNVQERRDVHLEVKQELGESDESFELADGHLDVKEVEDDFRDGEGRVTKSEGQKAPQKSE